MSCNSLHRAPRLVGTFGVALIGVAASLAAGSSTVYSSGIAGYSGKNAKKTCASCHSGGTAPTVAFSGPKYVLHGSQRSFGIEIAGGQQIAGGVDVANDVGTLVSLESGTTISAGELIQTTPKDADGNGHVSWAFDVIAPASPATLNLWGCGNSIDANGKTSGDGVALATATVTVVDSLARFVPYGQGLAGSGGFVPLLAGTDGPSAGPWSMQVSGGLGGAFALIWYGFAPDDVSPFFGGHFYIDLSGPFGRLPIVLSGPAGVAGAGSFAMNGIDVSAYAPLTLYFQVTVLDGSAIKHVALSNALELHIEK